MAEPIVRAALAERIFPPWPPRDGLLMRTARVGTWESQFVGAGRLTAFVTDHLLRFGAALDDIGLGVIFLQHHRVEVGLKLLLERAGLTQIPGDHRIASLRRRCEAEMRRAGVNDAWDHLCSQHGEFLELLDDVDPNSYVFRYPTDKRGVGVDRPPLVDLVALQAEGLRFHAAVARVVDALAIREGLPLTVQDARAAAPVLVAAIRAMTTADQALDAVDQAQAAARSWLGTDRDHPTAAIAETSERAAMQRALISELEHPLVRTLRLVHAQLGETSEAPTQPWPITPYPPLTQLTPVAMQRHLDGMVDWMGQTYATHLRSLGEAFREVYDLTADWPGIAVRQLHCDVGRFLSRMYVNFPPDDAPISEPRQPPAA